MSPRSLSSGECSSRSRLSPIPNSLSKFDELTEGTGPASPTVSISILGLILAYCAHMPSRRDVASNWPKNKSEGKQVRFPILRRWIEEGEGRNSIHRYRRAEWKLLEKKTHSSLNCSINPFPATEELERGLHTHGAQAIYSSFPCLIIVFAADV